MALPASSVVPATRYLCVFRQTLEEFRIPELLTLASLSGIRENLHFDSAQAQLVSCQKPELQTPFFEISLPSDKDVKLLASRAILVK